MNVAGSSQAASAVFWFNRVGIHAHAIPPPGIPHPQPPIREKIQIDSPPLALVTPREMTSPPRVPLSGRGP